MRIYGVAALALAGGLALAACGSGGYSTHSKAKSPVTTATAAPSIDTSPSPSSNGAPVRPGLTSLGATLVDAEGHTLYGLTNDMNGQPSCAGACAGVWPPLTISGSSLPAGLNAAIYSVVTRPDGSHQLRAGKWPLYRYAGDAKPGDVNGQGSGGVWFAVNTDGTLRK
jgi:predicted lipoprotein with Yx(FWY)xxD motif